MPCFEVGVAGLLLLVALVAAGMVFGGCGGANSGSRHSGLPSNTFHVESLTIIPFMDARPFELVWLRETVEAHIAVVRASGVSTRGQFRVRFYRTFNEVYTTHKPATDGPMWLANTQGPNARWAGAGFFGADGVLHAWIGTPKLEGRTLGHFLFHVWGAVPNDVTHLDPRWGKLDLEDFRVSGVLSAAR